MIDPLSDPGKRIADPSETIASTPAPASDDADQLGDGSDFDVTGEWWGQEAPASADAMEAAKSIGPFTIQVRKQENYSGEHREWFEHVEIPQGNRDVAKAALPVLQQYGDQRDAAGFRRGVEAAPVWLIEMIHNDAPIPRAALAAWETRDEA